MRRLQDKQTALFVSEFGSDAPAIVARPLALSFPTAHCAVAVTRTIGLIRAYLVRSLNTIRSYDKPVSEESRD